MSAPTSEMLSPAQVAERAKVSRRTVMRAIERLDLKAIRDNQNRWRIASQEADRWALGTCAPSEQRPPETPTNAHSDQALELAALKAENGQLKERLAATEDERNHWRTLAEKLADRPRFNWPWSKN